MKKKIFAVFMMLSALLAFTACSTQEPEEAPEASEEIPEETPEPHTHSFTAWKTEKAATCTASGVKTRSCNECDYSESEVVASTGHNPGSWIVTAEATCELDGERYKTCRICGDELSREVIKAFGHNYVETLVYPNRYAEGYTLNVCSSCNDGYKDDFVPSWGVVEYLYVVNEDGSCTVTRIFPNDVKEVHIPDYIADYRVTAVSDEALAGDTNVTLVRISDNVTSIGERAFAGCSALETVMLGSSITAIGKSAFDSCTSIKEITLPDSLLLLGEGAFADCRSLTSLDIPNGITEIPADLFNGCSSLVRVGFCLEVTDIGDRAFYGCRGLCEIPELTSTAYIGESAFAYCENLKSVTFSEELVFIGSSAFAEVISLESVNIPSIQLWLDVAFANIYSNPLNESARLYIASEPSEPITELDIPLTVSEISKYCFYGYDHLTSVTLTENTVSIGRYAFAQCKALERIDIASLYSIGCYAFNGCESLRSINIPDTVTYIGDCAFAGCTLLRTVNVPDAIEYLGRGAFLNCSSITKIAIPEAVAVIPAELCKGCTALASVSFPEGLSAIDKSAFEGCSSITELVLYEGLEIIGESAFMGASSLEFVKLPSSLTTVLRDAFFGCDSVTDVEITDILLWISIDFETAGSNPLNVSSTISIDGEPVREIVIPAYASEISEYSLIHAKGIEAVYFEGSCEDFLSLHSETNILLTQMMREGRLFFYSASEPEEEGCFWHYDNYGVIRKWQTASVEDDLQ